MRTMISIILALAVVGLIAFGLMLKEHHDAKLRDKQDQATKDLTLKRPATDAWRRHAGLD